MARRLIGLDIGTNAVTIAEVTPGTPPRLDLFAQVALPRDAMREGEIADEAVVTDAVARLRTEVGLKKATVRVGIASPRVVVRQVEMPAMSRDELAGALQFQAGELIPIPIEDAVLDFAILGTSQPDAESHDGAHGEPTMQVLLAAAYEATVAKLVAAVEAGGFQVGAVDLVPLALTRALARPIPVPVAAGGGGVALDDGIGAEGIVSFGGGVTAIAVHEAGIPQFVRVLGTGGRELTDAIASDLAVPPETAEALKRALNNPAPDEMVAKARTSVDRPLSLLLDEVRSSIDYYRNQPGAARLQRVIVTGGSAQLPGLPERLSALVGVPVEPAYMHDLLRVGDIGFAPEELPRLEPYLPAPVGLALGGANTGIVVDLMPKRRRSAVAKVGARVDRKLVAAGVAAVLVLGGLTYLGHHNVSSAKAKQTDAETAVKKLQSQIARETQAPGANASVSELRSDVNSILSNDVYWPSTIADIGTKLPAGVWLTGFQGQHTVAPTAAAPSAASASTGAAGSTTSAAPVAAPPASAGVICGSLPVPAGTITIAGVARNLPAISQFLQNLQQDPDVSTVWMSSVNAGKFGGADMLTFSVTAQLAKGARGHRLESFFKELSCK